MELCPALGITIPVGKDSMSMSTAWKDATGEDRRITAPISLIISAFAPVTDIRLSLTPQLQYDPSESFLQKITEKTEVHNSVIPALPQLQPVRGLEIGDSVLLLVDLGRGQNRLGGSILAQVVSQTGEAPPDVDHPADLKNFWNAIQQLGSTEDAARLPRITFGWRTAGGGHRKWRSPGTSAWTSRFRRVATPSPPLFNEELGAVIQIRASDLDDVSLLLRGHGLKSCVTRIGTLNPHYALRIRRAGQEILNESLTTLRSYWSDVTRRIATLRDNPACAESEYQLKLDQSDPGITPLLTFDLAAGRANTESKTADPFVTSAPFVSMRAQPSIAILREQGVNGQVEMAAAFDRAGFKAVDVHMTDILSGRVSLKNFRGLAACGGFSYGDVLGAGEGWAKSVLFHSGALAEFTAFFQRVDTFALGVCNGCQKMSNLRVHHPRCRPLAPFRAKPVGALRGPAGFGED